MSERTAQTRIKPIRRRRIVRCIGRIVFGVVAVVVAYLLFRMAYPSYLESKVPADAPRIAFSLDGTFLGRLGITDATYQRVMAEAGAKLIPVRPEESTEPNDVDELLDTLDIDGLLLTGGGDVDPNLSGAEPGHNQRLHRPRDEFEIALIHAAIDRNIPVLGICRGAQILNVALGGTARNLRHDPNIAGEHLTVTGHSVRIEPGGMLAKILGTTELEKVVSLHGQAAGEIAPKLRIAATGPGRVTEAIEADPDKTDAWLLAVQWHPELTLADEVQHSIFKAFVNAARAQRPEVRKPE